jgi:hypothetical protein
MNKERQKVISQLSFKSMLRTSMPALDQHSVAPIISSTPRRCRAGARGAAASVLIALPDS